MLQRNRLPKSKFQNRKRRCRSSLSTKLPPKFPQPNPRPRLQKKSRLKLRRGPQPLLTAAEPEFAVVDESATPTAEPEAASAEIDLSSEWDDTITVEADAPAEEAVEVETTEVGAEARSS